MSLINCQIQSLALLPNKTTEKMHIVFCADKSYIQHLGVALTSVSINNYSTDIDFHIICDSVAEADIKKFSILAELYKNNIYFYFIDKISFGDLNTGLHYSPAIFYRLAIPYILPKHLSKVLYLDSDLVCNQSLRNLWLTDIEKFPLAACTFENLSAVSRVDINNAVNRLGLFSGKYFNTGVMLINVELWRQENILVKTIEFIKHNPNLILYPDQDGLNKVIDGNLKVLDDRWNSVIAMDSEIPVLLQNAAIIHFTGSLKPWHKCSDPRREIYWNYLKKSPWSYAYSQRNRSPEERIIEIVTSWIYAIGHKTRQVRKILQSL